MNFCAESVPSFLANMNRKVAKRGNEMYNKECRENEIFVGNINARRDMSYLSGIDYRIGNQAYDIHEMKIVPSYMRPLFIAKESYNKYDSIMIARYK